MVSAVGENILTKECVSDIQQAKKIFTFPHDLAF